MHPLFCLAACSKQSLEAFATSRSCAIKGNIGCLASWAPGLGDDTTRARPTLVTALWQEGVVNISAGLSFSAATTLAGQVWTWGRNKYGQLGNGSFENGLQPRPVQGLERAVQAGPNLSTSHSMPLRHGAPLRVKPLRD